MSNSAEAVSRAVEARNEDISKKIQGEQQAMSKTAESINIALETVWGGIGTLVRILKRAAVEQQGSSRLWVKQQMS
jgi:hypothetical protein